MRRRISKVIPYRMSEGYHRNLPQRIFGEMSGHILGGVSGGCPGEIS